MRISIIGHSGSGKSTLARAISEQLNISHLHIDRLWFEAGGYKLHRSDNEGKERVRAYIKEKVAEFIRQDDWVSDGWYARVQPMIAERANQILFLDIPLARRLWNHLRRVFFSKRHPELTRWEDFKFTYQIIRRTFVHGPAMREFVRVNALKVKIFRTHKAIEAYLTDLTKNVPTSLSR